MLINYILLVLVIILMIPVSIFLIQILSAIFSKKIIKNLNRKSQCKEPSLAVLMPAHNEQLVISASILSIVPQLKIGDKLLVVADNCTDATASIATKLGVDIIERNNLNERGKGYALDYGLKHLEPHPPEVILIIDADCIVTKNSISKLVNACVDYDRPVQALYLMEAQPTPSLKQKIASFAWVVKNKARPLGMLNLNLPCQLMGTGMAFLWEDIKNINLASGHIVEDMKLGVDLARNNKAPIFFPNALVTSVFPPTEQAVTTQRTRWEHGHLSMIFNEVPKLLIEALKNKNFQMLGLACDLLVPPLAMLSLLCISTFLVSLVFASQAVIYLNFLLLSMLSMAIGLAWGGFGKNIISFKQLCYAPVYALIKVPLYIKFFLNKQVEWVRSKRD